MIAFLRGRHRQRGVDHRLAPEAFHTLADLHGILWLFLISSLRVLWRGRREVKKEQIPVHSSQHLLFESISARGRELDHKST